MATFARYAIRPCCVHRQLSFVGEYRSVGVKSPGKDLEDTIAWISLTSPSLITLELYRIQLFDQAENRIGCGN